MKTLSMASKAFGAFTMFLIAVAAFSFSCDTFIKGVGTPEEYKERHMSVLSRSNFPIKDPEMLEHIAQMMSRKFDEHVGFLFTKSMVHHVMFRIHLISSPFFLTIGPVTQMGIWASAMRHRIPVIHRFMGLIYVLSNVLSGITGIFLGYTTTRGITPRASGILFGVLSLVTISIAFLKIKQGEVQKHRMWMIRNYSIGFGVFLVRLLMFVGFVLKWVDVHDFMMKEQVHVEFVNFVFWFGFVLSCVIGEAVIFVQGIGQEIRLTKSKEK